MRALLSILDTVTWFADTPIDWRTSIMMIEAQSMTTSIRSRQSKVLRLG